jgi:hypothetical protein
MYTYIKISCSIPHDKIFCQLYLNKAEELKKRALVIEDLLETQYGILSRATLGPLHSSIPYTVPASSMWPHAKHLSDT